MSHRALEIALHLACKELSGKTGEPLHSIYQRMLKESAAVMHGDPEQIATVIHEMVEQAELVEV